MNYMADEIKRDLEIERCLKHACPIIQALWSDKRRHDKAGPTKKATPTQRSLQVFCTYCPSSDDIPHDKEEMCPDLCGDHGHSCILFRPNPTTPWGGCELADVCPCFCSVTPEWRVAYNKWRADRGHQNFVYNKERKALKAIDSDDDDAV